MTMRRRRDGEPNPIDGAQAVGPGAIDDEDGSRAAAGGGGPGASAGRVQGAWTTPAVVVRRPDGTVLGDDDAENDRHDDGGPQSSTPGSTPGVAPRRSRV